MFVSRSLSVLLLVYFLCFFVHQPLGNPNNLDLTPPILSIEPSHRGNFYGTAQEKTIQNTQSIASRGAQDGVAVAGAGSRRYVGALASCQSRDGHVPRSAGVGCEVVVVRDVVRRERSVVDAVAYRR